LFGTSPEPLYKLVSRELLSILMRRTGDGSSVSVRQLAQRSDVPRSTIGNLLAGGQQAVSVQSAHRIAQALGVDVLVLFIPVGRSAQLDEEQETAVSG
jgi:transcriptional regulator with XRE-family HTH domain